MAGDVTIDRNQFDPQMTVAELIELAQAGRLGQVVNRIEELRPGQIAAMGQDGGLDRLVDQLAQGATDGGEFEGRNAWALRNVMPEVQSHVSPDTKGFALETLSRDSDPNDLAAIREIIEAESPDVLRIMGQNGHLDRLVDGLVQNAVEGPNQWKANATLRGIMDDIHANVSPDTKGFALDALSRDGGPGDLASVRRIIGLSSPEELAAMGQNGHLDRALNNLVDLAVSSESSSQLENTFKTIDKMVTEAHQYMSPDAKGFAADALSRHGTEASMDAVKTLISECSKEELATMGQNGHLDRMLSNLTEIATGSNDPALQGKANEVIRSVVEDSHEFMSPDAKGFAVDALTRGGDYRDIASARRLINECSPSELAAMGEAGHLDRMLNNLTEIATGSNDPALQQAANFAIRNTIDDTHRFTSPDAKGFAIDALSRDGQISDLATVRRVFDECSPGELRAMGQNGHLDRVLDNLANNAVNGDDPGNYNARTIGKLADDLAAHASPESLEFAMSVLQNSPDPADQNAYRALSNAIEERAETIENNAQVAAHAQGGPVGDAFAASASGEVQGAPEVPQQDEVAPEVVTPGLGGRT